MIKITNYCKCGCGTEIAGNKIWSHGHNRRGVEHTDEIRDKISKTLMKYFEDPKEREKTSKIVKKHYAEMDDPGQEICNHHYIYDFNDLTKYTIPVTRSEHTTIHDNLRHAGLLVPCINMMKGD